MFRFKVLRDIQQFRVRKSNTRQIGSRTQEGQTCDQVKPELGEHIWDARATVNGFELESLLFSDERVPAINTAE
jgi:hypothetical protein